MNETHLGYIVAAYAITFAVIGGVTLKIVLDYRRLRKDLAALGKGRGETA